MSGGDISNKRNGHKGFHSVIQQTPPAPVLTFCNQPRIYEFLRRDIKGQDTALNGLAAIISKILQPHTERRVYKSTLGGPAGTGKRSTVQRVKNLLGMDTGGEYANQFLILNGSSVSDNTLKAGGKEGVTLLKRLKNAVTTDKSLVTGKKETLPYLCLFIEDIDKASAKFMDCLGPLFETGTYALTSNETFSIPKRTPLLVLFTTNSAATEINTMKRHDDTAAAEFIRQTLTKKWPDGNLMRRIEPIFPFYTLGTETLKPILMTKFEEYVQTSDITHRYGKSNIQYSDEVKRMLVDHVLVKFNTAHGIQGSISQLIRKLDIFFSTGLGVINNLLTEASNGGHHHQQLLSPIIVTVHSIDTHRFCQSLDQQLDNVVQDLRKQQHLNPYSHLMAVGSRDATLSIERVIDSILENPENHQIMEECNPTQEGTVNAVAMAYGDISLCSLVMNITYNNYQVVNHHDQKEEVLYLKKKLRRYKHNLKEVIQTIDRTSTESSFNSTMKKIADAKRELIESSSGSSSGDDDDDRYYHHPRLRQSNRVSPSSPTTVVEQSKKRPHSSISLPLPIYTHPICQQQQQQDEPIKKRMRLEDEYRYLASSSDSDIFEDDEDDDDDDDDEDLLKDLMSSSSEEEEEEEAEEEEVKEVCDSTATMACVIEEEEEGMKKCTLCKRKKCLDSFIHKRINTRTGQIRTSTSAKCITCRK